MANYGFLKTIYQCTSSKHMRKRPGQNPCLVLIWWFLLACQSSKKSTYKCTTEISLLIFLTGATSISSLLVPRASNKFFSGAVIAHYLSLLCALIPFQFNKMLTYNGIIFCHFRDVVRCIPCQGTVNKIYFSSLPLYPAFFNFNCDK